MRSRRGRSQRRAGRRSSDGNEPILRLTSIDLNACKDVRTLEELFNFGNDYLGLVKAGVIASGLVPASLEGTSVRLDELLASVVRPGHGLEVVSKVNDIPKGSRLAVSTRNPSPRISPTILAFSGLLSGKPPSCFTKGHGWPNG